MRCAVWFSNYGLPNISFDLPYRSRSPVLFETVEYETKQDILDEVYRVLEEADERGYDIGQSLYYQLPFFCSPAFIISDWCWDMLTDYFTVTKFNVPLARDLDSLDPWRLDCFSIIESEIQKITAHERGKNGNN